MEPDTEKKTDVILNLEPLSRQELPSVKFELQAEQAKELLGDESRLDPAQIRVQYRVYRRRWILLFVVAVLNCANCMGWIAFAPVANFADEFYAREGGSNLLSMIFLLIAIPIAIFAMWSETRFGTRTALYLAVLAQTIGTAIKLISSLNFVAISIRFPIALVGQCIAACAYPFIMFLPTKVAASWFPDTQRSLATTIGAMANPLGVLLSNIISPQLVTSVDHIVFLNALIFTPSIVVCVVAFVFIRRAQPKIPPSPGAHEMSTGFCQGLKKCLKSRSFMILMLVQGGGMGVFNTLYTILQQLLCPSGYSNQFSGLCGALLIGGGVVGATCSGIFVDKTKKFEETYKILISLAVVAGCILVVMLLQPNLHVPILILITFMGFCGLGAYPISLELSHEATFPVSATISSGLVVLSGQFQSGFFIPLFMAASKPITDPRKLRIQTCTVVEREGDTTVQPKDMTLPSLIFISVAAMLALINLLFFHPKLRRIKLERIATSAANELVKRDQLDQQHQEVLNSSSKSEKGKIDGESVPYDDSQIILDFEKQKLATWRKETDKGKEKDEKGEPGETERLKGVKNREE